MQDLKGKVALVTGGGRGLGEAICQVLGEAGARVIIADVRSELGEETAERLRSSGCAVEALELDVSDDAKVEEGMQRITSRYGRIDVLVNNAGIDLTVPIDEMPVDEWRKIVAVNLTGPFLTSRQALKIMKAQGGGQIVNIVSTAAKRAWANASAYHASKWGLLGFTHALHVEARMAGIKVTAVIAGGMRTPFLLDRFPDIDASTLQDPRNVAEAIRNVLLLPDETVIPELMVLPMRETSWP